MLLVTVTSISDQVVADRMRFVAKRMHASDPFIEWAVDEAVAAYRETGNMALAINAGVESLQRVFDIPKAAVHEPEPIQRVPFAWVENGYVIAGALLVALALLYARANGWLS